MAITTLTKSNTFTASTTAESAKVNANFDELVSKVNELIALVGAVTATAAEMSHTSGVTSAIQTQMDNKIEYNRIINGNFAVNQRVYVSGAAVGAGLYGHDRWKMAAAGDTYTFATVNNKTTVTIPAGKVLRQVVEGINLQTGTYYLTWEGTAQAKIGAGSMGDSGVSGSITGGTNTTIEFGPGTVAMVRLSMSAAVAVNATRTFAEELFLCQRYCEKSYNHAVTPGTATGVGALTMLTGVVTGGTVGIQLNFKVSKCTNATVTVYSPATGTAGKIADETGAVDFTANLTDQGENSAFVYGAAVNAINATVHFLAVAEL